MAACITAPQLKVIDLCHSGKASAETATPIVAAIFEKLLPTFPASYSELSLCVGNFSGTRVKLWDNCVATGTAKRAPFLNMVILGTGDLCVTHPISLPSLKKIVLEDDFSRIQKPRLLSKFVEQLKVWKGLHSVETETLEISDIYCQLTSADLKLFEGLVKVSKRRTKSRNKRVS
ncbi:hypothetical protein PC9H_011766 [Pleurotus ostreatus]|uniref:Uncharacterized protein n=1 Tax=Pleurotus ostreatus TaxID=5322 RepID=A0A8H6ZM34_PLEOS|nr:uncharacterized protein PC9H_011766 [Pleurotus ostreatus]KAF7421245.1 hypothetical protein PC9H_011766 [Pleurotus ostreatus]